MFPGQVGGGHIHGQGSGHGVGGIHGGGKGSIGGGKGSIGGGIIGGGGGGIIGGGGGGGGIIGGGRFPSPVGHDESVPLYLGSCSRYNSPVSHVLVFFFVIVPASIFAFFFFFFLSFSSPLLLPLWLFSHNFRLFIIVTVSNLCFPCPLLSSI